MVGTDVSMGTNIVFNLPNGVPYGNFLLRLQLQDLDDLNYMCQSLEQYLACGLIIMIAN